METKEFFELQEEFFAIAKENLSKQMASKDFIANTPELFEEIFADTVDEATVQVSDWYSGCSYYPKPEDILVDFFFLTHEQAHRFLPLFKGENNHDAV